MTKTMFALPTLLLTLALTAAAQPAPGPTQGGPPPGMPPGMPPGGAPPNLPPGMPPMPPAEPVHYVALLEVADGQRHGAAARRPQVGASAARQLQLRSAADRTNGLYLHGQGAYTLADSRIELSGKGKSDFDGIAAGALARGQSQLTLRRVQIETRGVVSSALTATDQSTVRVSGARLIARGGAVPSGYTRRIGPGMMEPPTPLGLVGTARTVLVMGEAKAYLRDSRIEADGWGALSTDAARGAYLEADNCDVVVRRSGYGTYADHGARVLVKRSRLDVATFGAVIAGDASVTFQDVKSQSQGNTVMIHSVMGSGTEVSRLAIQGGQLHSLNAAILVKSANAEIEVDGAALSASNGDLLLGVVNDDSFASKAAPGTTVPGIRAAFKRSKLVGNILHLDPSRVMTVHLHGSSLTGAIRDATVSFDAGSRWTATADSTLTLLGPVALTQIDAVAGVTITAKAGAGLAQHGRHALRSGGQLVVE